VLIIGSATMTVLGLQAVGGWSGLEARVPADFFSMWKPMNHPNFPWTGIIFGAPILGVWYWCTDQHIVQRVLAARNVSAARTGTIFRRISEDPAGVIFVLPGIIAAALYQDIRGGSADAAYPALVTRLFAGRVQGLGAGGYARRAHELARLCVQLLLDAAHVGRCTASSGPTRASSGWWRWDGSPPCCWSGWVSCGFRS